MTEVVVGPTELESVTSTAPPGKPGLPPCVFAFGLYFDFIAKLKIPASAEVNDSHNLKVRRAMVLVVYFVAFRPGNDGFVKTTAWVSDQAPLEFDAFSRAVFAGTNSGVRAHNVGLRKL